MIPFDLFCIFFMSFCVLFLWLPLASFAATSNDQRSAQEAHTR